MFLFCVHSLLGAKISPVCIFWSICFDSIPTMFHINNEKTKKKNKIEQDNDLFQNLFINNTTNF